MNEELSPCPFCGNRVDYAYDLELTPYGVHCSTCHMIARFTRVKRPGLHESFGATMASIRSRWNRRTNP